MPIQVREIMIPVDHYPSVRDNSTLRDAVRVIEESRLEVDGKASLPRVLLVFDRIDVLVGYLRRRDIMAGLEPAFLVPKPVEYRQKLFDIDVDPNLTGLTFGRTIQGIRRQAGRPVSDVMRPIEALLAADDHLIKAVHEMVSLDLALIPVVESGRLLGVVRSVDVFQALVRLLE